MDHGQVRLEDDDEGASVHGTGEDAIHAGVERQVRSRCPTCLFVCLVDGQYVMRLHLVNLLIHHRKISRTRILIFALAIVGLSTATLVHWVSPPSGGLHALAVLLDMNCQINCWNIDEYDQTTRRFDPLRCTVPMISETELTN